jgi:hypothetical protein
VRDWLRRTVELQRELAAIAEVDPRWWLLAAGVAFAETRAPSEIYLACDAEPDADTFMGYLVPRPRDLVADAIARAHAARTAVRELDGDLPDQALAVTIDRHGSAPPLPLLRSLADHAAGAATRPSALDVAAFAVGSSCLVAAVDDPALAHKLAGVMRGEQPPPWHGATPFVCVSIGDEPVETARHGHRRAWTDRGGPWLGLGRAGELAVVSTCHLIIDGYGHAHISARIAELVTGDAAPAAYPALALAPVPGAVPLAITWRELAYPTPRVIPLAYELGRLLHRGAGDPRARFSPTIQIPVARGRKDDPLRLRRRIVSATTSVQFDGGVPEPFTRFEARVRGVFARESDDRGLVSRLLAAARAVPVPLAWKRKSISAKRPRWLESFAQVIGGRALLSRIAMDVPVPPLAAVSSPSLMATERDPVGGCVITIVDDGERAAITMCGSGFAGSTDATSAFLDELLASVDAAPATARARPPTRATARRRFRNSSRTCPRPTAVRPAGRRG